MGDSTKMELQEWLDDVRAKYIVEIDERVGSDHFNSRVYRISDPNTRGITFEIGCNEKGEVSTFDTATFSFAWFNIAEGVSPGDILEAGGACLSGQLSFKKKMLFKKYKLIFGLTTFKGESSAVELGDAQEVIEGYLRGYTLA